MAEYRDFAATNEPGTCLWCGRKLRWRPTSAGIRDRTIPMTVPTPDGGVTRNPAYDERVNAYDKPGDYGDGFFCGLRCGYQFGEALAGNGRRLRPRDSSPAPLKLDVDVPIQEP